MPSDYAAIRSDNERRYGTDIARIGPMLLADRYDDRTHFIYELLQNAEDALARRSKWQGVRAVQFHLASDMLRISHFGNPFDDHDVRGICGIAESTKGKTAIGRFGIGFKSVYAYTSRPEVHSGEEDFAIESFVWPTAAPQIIRVPNETVITLPLNAGPSTSRAEIANGLQRLGPGTLLFLREIEEIEWQVDRGPSGVYLRSKAEVLGPGIRRIEVLGQEAGKKDMEESWLIFFREVSTEEGFIVGQVEIAFSILENKERSDWSIQPVANSPLVVFFPTVVPTNLGFLVQGPYRTTPSRDNVPRNDPWNQGLVKHTASLLVDALAWLRDNGHFDVSALRCLPLDRSKFPEDGMFAPLFETVRAQLKSERLLPSAQGSHVPANAALLARTQELRQLVDPNQLGALFGVDSDLAWLSGDISPDRTPEVRQYLMRELDITEVTPEMMLARLDKEFLEAQSDAWILKLYDFLHGQPALIRGGRIDDVPIIRLLDGTHVTARENGQPRAFLPSEIETAFPTVRRTVCTTKEARALLESLGLTEPDPVDDVVWNVLPRYCKDEIEVSDDDYRADVRRILDAFGTDSKTQRDKLLTALRDASFVRSVDAGDATKWMSKPSELYIATARLKDLFAGVKGIFLVDDDYDCLRGEDIRELLEACGASRTLQIIQVHPELTGEQRRNLRIAGGCESSSGGERFLDYALRGLDLLLAMMQEFDAQVRGKRAALLWEALGDLEERRGAGVFSGVYYWMYYHGRSVGFDSAFVQLLNVTPWIPDAEGTLQKPSSLVFDTLGWKPHPFLVSKIPFKPPILEMLAKEAGIEPGILDLLRKLGVTSEAELRERLGLKDEPLSGIDPPANDAGDENDKGTANASDTENDRNDTGQHGDSGKGGSDAGEGEGDDDGDGDGADNEQDSTGASNGGGQSGGAQGGRAGAHGTHTGGTRSSRPRTPGSNGGRPFISYVAVDHDDEDGPDPDDLTQQARMDLEEKAIRLILGRDASLQRTPTHNPGFDLFEPDEDGDPVRWVEVKAMTGALESRPVCLSRTQFDCATTNGDAFWLYVVEYAGDSSRARILCIQDPYGKTKHFTFDHGWVAVAVPG